MMTDPQKKIRKTRKTKAQAAADREQLEGIEKSRKGMLETAQRAVALRKKDREFHGLNREFRHAQAQLTVDYGKSRDVKHPRDVGQVREQLLRGFLSGSGFLPRRYAVTETSTRVAATTGHVSNELDIVFYDPLDSVRLMERGGVYEVFPIESVHGAIQVKSRLSVGELDSALQNIASVKRLRRAAGGPPVAGDRTHAFGVIFAYEIDMAWLDVVRKLEAFVAANPPEVWPNAVVVLNVGMFVIGTQRSGFFLNRQLEGVQDPVVHGRPDAGDLLYSMHGMLLAMLRETPTFPPPFEDYFTLPLVAGDLPYRFSLGVHAEIGECDEHGDFARKITEEGLQELVRHCSSAHAINWVKANDIGMGGAGNDEEAYARQPGDVRIYNPDGLPLQDILFRDSLLGGRSVPARDYELVEADGMTILLPNHYVAARGLITGCPKCAKRARATSGAG